MKTSTNKKELKKLNACTEGYETFIKAHGDKEVNFSECIDSNGWEDVWWLISKIQDQLSESQLHDLRVFGCNKALINIEKIKPYCSNDDYELIVNYLNEPKESAESAARSAAWSAESAARSAAWSAARSAAWSEAWSTAESAELAASSAAWSAASSAAWSAARSASESAARSARSVVTEEFTQDLKELFLKWENTNE